MAECSPANTGYLSGAYAHASADTGEPVALPLSGGHILVRRIRGTPFEDAVGTYPLFACRNWALVAEDLARLDRPLVTLGVVADPFGDHDHTCLHAAFPDVCIPFKTHFVVDLLKAPGEFVSPHHRRNVRRALARTEVVPTESPSQWLSCWIDLYDLLTARHGVTGMARFSPWSFAKQLEVPGIVALRAVTAGETVGMLLCYRQGDVAYYHLGAYSHVGYELGASFALFWRAIEYFADRGLRWLDLGGGAGWKNDGTDGLSRFKKGWATDTRTVWFCGRIFDHELYRELVRATGTQRSQYFPAYRTSAPL